MDKNHQLALSLGEEIRSYLGGYDRDLQSAAANVWYAGSRLSQVKELLPRGEFGAYVETHARCSRSRASYCMRVFREYPAVEDVASSTVRKLIAPTPKLPTVGNLKDAKPEKTSATPEPDLPAGLFELHGTFEMHGTVSCPRCLGTGRIPKPKQKHRRSEHFAEWWASYPRRIGKAAAETAYRKAILQIADEHPDPAAYLLERATAFAASEKGQGEFCPYPATWLNQARYDDDPAAWRESRGVKKKSTIERVDLS